jgi:hypothetical protein
MSENNKIQGVARKPIIHPDEMITAVKALFPNIPKWYIQFAEVATTLLDASQYSMVGHSHAQDCQLKTLGHGEACGRGADFILVSVMLEKGAAGVEARNSRVRYYCGPCVYATMNRAIQSIASADKLDDGGAWEGLEEECGIILEQRVEFVEDSIERSAEVLENKYPTDGDEIVEGIRKKFEGAR